MTYGSCGMPIATWSTLTYAENIFNSTKMYERVQNNE